MTFIIKEENIGKYNIAILQDKFSSAYKVRLSHTIDGENYRTEKENIYVSIAAANRRFNTLKKGL